MWTEEQLRRVTAPDEIAIAPVRRNGELRTPTIIWAVQVDDSLYVRAAYGANQGWHGVARISRRARLTAGGIEQDVTVQDADTAVLDRVDAAYRDKYGRRYVSIVESINDPERRATTQWLQSIHGYSPVQAGLAFLPVTLPNFAAALASPASPAAPTPTTSPASPSP